MDDQSCPRCKTTKYRNPSLKLMVNVCGHSLCENCVELIFVRGSGPCLECGVPLRRNNFRLQLFEDAGVEKEVDIRKRIIKIYNKREDDFETLRDYNDYLEEIETIIFNLANGIDVDETNRRVEQYKKEYRELIMKNKSKLSKDEEYVEYLIELEKEEAQYYRNQMQEEAFNKEKEKKKNKDALIDELMFSDLPANHILATHKRELEEKQSAEEEAVARQEKQTHFSTGIMIGKRDVFMPMPKQEVVPTYTYEPITITYCGPEPPASDALFSDGYMSHIRSASSQDKGGGFEAHIACQRALQDAYCGLFFFCDATPSPVPFGGLEEGDVPT